MKGIPVLTGFWRESARSLRLFVFNAYVVVPSLLFILHIRWWTLILLVATIAAMTVIERFGFTVPAALLAVRAKLAGRHVKRRRSCFAKRLDR